MICNNGASLQNNLHFNCINCSKIPCTIKLMHYTSTMVSRNLIRIEMCVMRLILILSMHTVSILQYCDTTIFTVLCGGGQED